MSNAGVSGKVEKIGWTCFCLDISFQCLHLTKQPSKKTSVFYDASIGRLLVQKNFDLLSNAARKGHQAPYTPKKTQKARRYFPFIS
jgi:hypothetical protein